jgi:hypothetical protein
MRSSAGIQLHDARGTTEWLDPEHHRAFLACEGNELMTVFDLDKHAPIAFLPLPGGPDVIKFDPGLGRIYVACYSGFISVFQADDADHYRKLEDFRVQHAVHSLAVDPQTHRVYAPEQEEDGRPVARMVVFEAVVSGDKKTATASAGDSSSCKSACSSTLALLQDQLSNQPVVVH